MAVPGAGTGPGRSPGPQGPSGGVSACMCGCGRDRESSGWPLNPTFDRTGVSAGVPPRAVALVRTQDPSDRGDIGALGSPRRCGNRCRRSSRSAPCSPCTISPSTTSRCGPEEGMGFGGMAPRTLRDTRELSTKVTVCVGRGMYLISRVSFGEQPSHGGHPF